MLQLKTLLPISAASLLMALAACGSSGYDEAPAPMPPAPVQVGDTIVLTASGKLISFNRASPATTVGSVTVSGLANDERLIGMDLRPADGLLYALSSRGRVYTVDPSTGAAALRSTLTADPADSSDPFVALAGAQFGVDFNPVVDRLRVVSSSGQNLRINVDTGATVTDTVLNLAGSAPAVVAAGYTNGFDGATATQLFDLNATDGMLYVQTPPNDGVLATAPGTPNAPISLGVAFTSASDLDIDAVSNEGFVVLTVGGSTQIYRIDLRTTNGAAAALGPIGVTEPVLGLVSNRRAPTATVFALTTDSRLLRFNPRTPNTIAATVTLAAPAGEQVVGIDIRPSDGRLYALIRTADGTGRVYTVDEGSGGMTLAATLNQALSGALFSVDFNPAANALRVISDSGQSLAVNLTTAPGSVTVNGMINSATIPAPTVIAAAYLNSGVSATPPATTTLYSIEASTDVLTTQVPATGTLGTVGPLGRDAAGTAGFDIAGGRNGLALAALGGSGGAAPHTLFEVNLATGAMILPRGLTADAARIGGADGPALRDIAIRF